MISTIELNKKNGEKVIGRFEVLNLEHIDKIMELQKVVIEALDDKQLYAPSEKEEFAEYIRDIGKVVGVVEEESNELKEETKQEEKDKGRQAFRSRSDRIHSSGT